MSFDPNLETTCNHTIYKELSELDTDRKSIRVSKPISSIDTISVYASDTVVSKSLYSIIYDPNTTTVNQPRMVYFKTKWRSTEDYFTITYITIKNYCPKCAGLEIINDLSYDVRGSMIVARDEKLLLQNAEKFTVTELNSNPFHRYIGTSLINLLGHKITDLNYTNTRITQEISETLGKFKDMQNQYRLSRRPMTDGEILDTVQNISVEQDPNDPTILLVTVILKAQSGKTVEYQQFLKIG
jgi:hypothetical protein